MTLPGTVRAVAAGAVTGMLLAACFSEHSSGPDVARVSCARAKQPPGPDTAFVVVEGFTYTPAQLTVVSGTRVVWVNCEPAGTPGHTTTVDAGAWDSPTLAPGDVFSVQAGPGTYDYHCRPHPFMQAQVVVQ